MEDYISKLSNEQKSLLITVQLQNCKFEDIDGALNQFPNLIEDAVFSYILLVAALDRKHSSISKLLIKKGCWVTCPTKTNHYKTPLFYAIMLDDMSIFKKLVRRGASILDKDASSKTPLELAVQSRNPEFWNFIVRRLNSDELDPNNLEHVAIFHAACYRGNVSLVKKFVMRDFPVNDRAQLEEWTGATPLQIAMKNHRRARKVVAFLLNANADFDAVDKQGNTLIHSLLKWLVNPQVADDELVDMIVEAYVYHYDKTKFSNPTNQYGISHFHVLCAVNWDHTSYEDDSTKLLGLLKFFIERGLDINSSNLLTAEETDRNINYAGYTALHWAARNSCLNILQLLLENGADPTKTDAMGNTPLHVLEFDSVNKYRMAELLLEYGASVDVKNSKGDTPLHRAFLLQGRNKPLMQIFLSASREVSDLISSCGISYLHIASTIDLDKVMTLIKNGATVGFLKKSQWSTYNGYSALHFAIAFNRVEIVEYLLANGARINFETSRSETTPLYLACTEQLEYFYNPFFDYFNAPPPLPIEGITSNSKGDEDTDWIKNRENQMQILELLLKHGASLDQEYRGMTPIAAVCHSSIAFTLNPFAETESRSVYSEVLSRRKMVIDILLKYGADINSRDGSGKSPLHILFDECDDDKKNTRMGVAELLLKRGASVDVVDENGYTPLHLAVEESSLTLDDGDRCKLDDPSFIDLFLEYGANINTRDYDLRTPLRSAMGDGDYDSENREIFVKLLQQPNIDIDAQDEKGDTPLLAAICYNNLFCVKQLLEAGADIDIENFSGDSPVSKIRRCPDSFYQRDASNICTTVIEHVAKLVRLNHFITDKVKIHLEGLKKFIDMASTTTNLMIEERIDEEIKKLKLIKIDNYTSLYQILIKSPNNMAKHSRNENLQKILLSSQLEKDFPIFSGFLQRQFKKGLSRSPILEPAIRALRVVTSSNWPRSCSEQILSHLDNDQLKSLIQSISVDDISGISVKIHMKLKNLERKFSDKVE